MRRPRRHRDRVHRGRDVALGRGVVLDVAPGGRLVLGDGVRVGERTRIRVAPGARVEIGAGTRLGERCVVAAQECIVVGRACVLGAEVVLADAEPVLDEVDIPVRLQGLRTAPVAVGDRAMLDATAVVGPGVTVGAGARVGMRAVVTADVPAGGRVDGVSGRVPGSRRLVRRD